jgi:hypothetical protein
MEIFTMVLPEQHEPAALRQLAEGRAWVIVSVPDDGWVDEIGRQVLVGSAIGKDLAGAVRAARATGPARPPVPQPEPKESADGQ